MNIIDRRPETGGKSLVNKQRFFRRERAAVREAVREAAKGRSVTDVTSGQAIKVKPRTSTHEPTLRKGSQGGKREYVLPGNKKYVQGDTIARPEGGGKGSGAGGGDGEDGFEYMLSNKEFLEFLFEYMELPDLARKKLAELEETKRERAGFSKTGSATQLDVEGTFKNSMARRIALKRPKREDVEKAQQAAAAFAADDESSEAVEARATLDRLQRRLRTIPFIDEGDKKYRRFEDRPVPVARAVMFDLMDVSGSMDEKMKTLAKDFFRLLYLFLKTRYEHVETVFIRHTDVAKEVDEQTFFHSRESGGTVVSSALELMDKIIRDRYPQDEWNIYGAQASDGDNDSRDRKKTAQLLHDILPKCQYYAYIEVDPAHGSNMTDLWSTYMSVMTLHDNMAMREVHEPADVYPVLQDLFSVDRASPKRKAALKSPAP